MAAKVQPKPKSVPNAQETVSAAEAVARPEIPEAFNSLYESGLRLEAQISALESRLSIITCGPSNNPVAVPDARKYKSKLAQELSSARQMFDTLSLRLQELTNSVEL